MTNNHSSFPGRALCFSVESEDRLSYEEFKALVREFGERRVRQGGLVPIPELWRRCQGEIPRADFDRFVVALDADGLVHLLSHVDTASLSEDIRAECLKHPTGPFLYWIRWL